MVQFLCIELFLYFVGVNAALGNEILLCLVLQHDGNKVVNAAGVAEKHLAFAILYVLLNV